MECLTDDFLRCFTDELCSWILAIKSKHFRVRDSFDISLISKDLKSWNSLLIKRAEAILL